MGIFAEDIEKGVAFLSGLFRFTPEGKFTQAVISLTSDCVLVYNDNAPDSINGETWMYSVKLRFPKETVAFVANEVMITKNPSAQTMNRLVIQIKGVEKPYYFFYTGDGIKVARNFIAGLKHYGYPAENRENKLSF